MNCGDGREPSTITERHSMPMTKADVLNGARGKPVEYVSTDGFKCLLRPLSFGERRELFDWHQQHSEEPGSAMELQAKFLLLAVCDEQGKPLLEPADLNDFAGPLADEVAKEIARRNGLDGKASAETGKA